MVGQRARRSVRRIRVDALRLAVNAKTERTAIAVLIGLSRMRYSASEKLEIIRLVEESTLPVRRNTAIEGGVRNADLFQALPAHRRGTETAPNQLWQTD